MNLSLNLEPDEQELLNSYERGEWQSVAGFQEKLRQYQSYAIAAFETLGLVGIALSEEDVRILCEKAAAAGIPYRRFIANVVHQYVTGNLVEKSHRD